MKFERSSGILLHPTSLPGPYGIGELGREAKEFVDFLVEAEQKLWQVFPLGHTGYGDSPYQCFSAFAGNPLLISSDDLVERGYLDVEDLKSIEVQNGSQVDFGWVIPRKFALLRKAFVTFRKSSTIAEKKKIENFKKKNRYWIDDYALFMSLKDHFGGKSWAEWPDDIRIRSSAALEKYREILRESVEFYEFMQWLFFDQWLEIKSYANRNYVKIVGDLPIFIAFDSADAWANPGLFLFDNERRPTHVAGVPPDYFSATGQLWGNPLYDWKKMKEDNFSWWVERIKGNAEMMDYIRIDHFIGFTRYWAVPAGDKTAVNGTWDAALGWEMFDVLKNELGDLPIIAEDLGSVTAEVIKMRDHFGFPGMKILEFAFESDLQFLPHRCHANCVIYTGTHDNDTCVGWFNNVNDRSRKTALEYMNSSGVEIHWDMIRTAWGTHANIAICQAQDLFGLDSEARMNFPGKFGGNWSWRMMPEQLNPKVADRLAAITRIFER